eukprot:CAMPEP_0174760060 /NCGR_PEP_ID=MMETSP1094-20130205/108583_1 /TAXON_ID=156173 /ORGANISM="Chrysochromulina brevifilum, Strain UTEX LB 985" /LENGTH=590 /DNA_ID=CAMNT_0015966001 /DNA_START=26 /DNA_END=1797 /DNA_ORIENTATION=+
MSSLGPPKPGIVLAYGTAGFRARATVLDSTFFRMGMLAVLRSRSRGGLAVGLMVTASHNAESDNGIKLIDPDGGMLDQSWEAHATALANAADDLLTGTFDSLAASIGVTGAGGGKVLVARDTRSHSERLALLALDGIASVGGSSEDFKLLTTPQLHHIVRHANGTAAAGRHVGPAKWASEAGYCEMLADAFGRFVTAEVASSRGALWVDAACGVGAPQLATLQRHLGSLLPLTIANAVGDGALNEGCGAEYVQKGRKPPRGLEAPPSDQQLRACSIDGDADRIVFHFWRGDEWRLLDGDKIAAAVCVRVAPLLTLRALSALLSTYQSHFMQVATEWRLLDGDKIAALFALFVCEELSTLALQPALSMAVVQTAYANGASGRYIGSLGVPIRLAKTGVKFVHHEAVKFDVSVYFEANGHGTLLFSDAAVDAIVEAQKAASTSGDSAKEMAAARLLAARQLINQAIGDALSDMLLVEAILSMKGWSFAQWDALYEDLPSRQTKLAVADRTVITTTADETQATAPADLQPQLNGLAAQFESGRCFVRPSGTEDVVRVYAEASTEAKANELALIVAQTTWKLAGGVGDMPTSIA